MACVRLPPMCSKANMDLVLIVCHHLQLARRLELEVLVDVSISYYYIFYSVYPQKWQLLASSGHRDNDRDKGGQVG